MYILTIFFILSYIFLFDKENNSYIILLNLHFKKNYTAIALPSKEISAGFKWLLPSCPLKMLVEILKT